MSFSGKVKEELLEHYARARHCDIAELSAIVHMAGEFKVGHGGVCCLKVHTENLGVARKCFTLLQKTFNISTETRVQQENQQTGYFCRIDDPELIRRILQGIKFLDQTGSPTSGEESLQDGLRCPVSRLLIRNSCCQRAFLRGAFLAAGSMSNPGKGYHLEIVCSRPLQAQQILEILTEFEIEGRIVQRKKYYVVYIKEGAGISDFLNVVEAHVALMEFENSRIVREVRNTVNRRVNCETANITKVTAAARQVDDILFLQQKYGFEKLPVSLRQMAEVRLEYPEAPLKELGMYLDPPVGKSGVNHRLRKLCELADAMRS